MRICILTHALKTNYGGLLQAFALQKVLRDMGHDVVTASESAKRLMGISKRVIYFCYHVIKRYIFGNKAYNPFKYLFVRFNREYKIKSMISVNTDRFINNHIANIDYFEGKTAPTQAMLNQFDALVVGSDQVWRAAYIYTPAYFLDFTKDVNIKRIAYAASFGIDNLNEYSEEYIAKCSEGVKLFDAISVREESGVELCRKNFGVEAVHLLDPTMLLNKEDYLDVIEEEDQAERDDVLMCYVLDKSDEKRKIISLVADKLNLTPLEVMPQETLGSKTNDISRCVYPSVSKWLAGFRDAKFVVTDSFHGTVFSIIFNKPFVVVRNSARGSSRFTSLLKLAGLEDRIICSVSDISDDMLESINYTTVNQRVENAKILSKEFIDKWIGMSTSL